MSDSFEIPLILRFDNPKDNNRFNLLGAQSMQSPIKQYIIPIIHYFMLQFANGETQAQRN